MKVSVFPTSLLADISYDLRMSSSLDGYADFDLVLSSGVLSYVDVEFQYRLMPGDDWLTDASLSCTTALAAKGSVLIGLPCSPTGTITNFRWNHFDNGLSSGTACEVRVVIQPSISAAMKTLSSSYRENISSRMDRSLNKFRDKNFVGFSQLGYALCLEDDRLVVYNNDLYEILSISGLTSPLFAQGKTDEGYIILDSGVPRLIECDLDGVITKNLNISSLSNNPKFFHYDSLTNNLLLSGGSIHKVYEMSWNNLDFGTILWEHGQISSGSSSGFLNNPEGICYAEWNRDIVLIADLDNNRIVSIDRSVSPQTENYITSVLSGSINIPLKNPSRVSTWQGKVIIGEKRGVRQSFDPDRASHPSLVRATTRETSPDTENEMLQYRNLVFAPILRAVE